MLAFTSIDLTGLIEQYNTLEGWLLLGGFGVLLLFSVVTVGGKKGKITTGRQAGGVEKRNLAFKALSQIHFQKKRKRKLHNYKKTGVTLWSGTPRYWWKGRWRKLGARLQILMGSPPTFYLPDMQRSCLVLGSPGSGKTASIIDRALESAFQQGFPVLLYDKKGDQTRLHGALAALYGYEVHVFSPGRPYTGVLNPLDFMEDERDAIMALEIASTINRNASDRQSGKSDEFFSKAGDTVAAGLMQLVKSELFPREMADFATVYAVLQLPDLVVRLDYGIQSGRISPWIAPSFVQLMQAKAAEKTVSGILSTATRVFNRFIQASMLPSFIGPSTIPQCIEGKQLIIFELDEKRRASVAPLIAGAIASCVNANMSQPRSKPLIVSLDELPSINLEQLRYWVNEHRSNLGCYLLGVQSLNQIYEAYGDKMGASICSACATHIVFNPGDQKTAEEYSKRCGEKDVLLKNRQIGRSVGGAQANRSYNVNESIQKVSLYTPDQINRFPPGNCIFLSPAMRVGKEGYIPLRTQIKLSKSDLKRADECSTRVWSQYVEPYLIKRAVSSDPQQLSDQLKQRLEAARQALLLPDEVNNSSSSSSLKGAQVKGGFKSNQHQMAMRVLGL